MIDLDLVITVDEVGEILTDLEHQELLRVGQAEVILRELLPQLSDDTTKLGVLMETLLNQCGINLLAVYAENDVADVDDLGQGSSEKGQGVETPREAPAF